MDVLCCGGTQKGVLLTNLSSVDEQSSGDESQSKRGENIVLNDNSQLTDRSSSGEDRKNRRK